jgi:hypothetical protein
MSDKIILIMITLYCNDIMHDANIKSKVIERRKN